MEPKATPGRTEDIRGEKSESPHDEGIAHDSYRIDGSPARTDSQAEQSRMQADALHQPVTSRPALNGQPSEKPEPRAAAEEERSRIRNLLNRMRTGDREAAAEFMNQYGSRVLRRIRGKLSRPIRRLFDSQEILSTVQRRLDRVIHERKLLAAEAEQLWAMIFRIADRAVIDKARIFDKLRKVEGPDTDFSYLFLQRLEEAERRQPDGAEIEIDNVIECLPDETDREILTLWLQGARHNEIAGQVGIASTGVRKRWEMIRRHLRRRFEAGIL